MSSTYLYIDTTNELTIALLDESFKLRNTILLQDKRTASILHENINSLLDSEGRDFSSVNGVIVNNGPGSYTGIRVGEGVAKILEMDGIKVVSFLEHEAISRLETNGSWVANAFKEEFFVFSWGENVKAEKKLVKQDALEKHLIEPVFSNDQLEIQNKYTNSKKYLLDNLEKVASICINEGIRKEPYYFRNIEDEFKIKKA
tara:strand:+ start:1352 stop:1954 length:603 start_codon:yes stop_codon:yes gene_type:complete